MLFTWPQAQTTKGACLWNGLFINGRQHSILHPNINVVFTPLVMLKNLIVKTEGKNLPWRAMIKTPSACSQPYCHIKGAVAISGRCIKALLFNRPSCDIYEVLGGAWPSTASSHLDSVGLYGDRAGLCRLQEQAQGVHKTTGRQQAVHAAVRLLAVRNCAPA